GVLRLGPYDGLLREVIPRLKHWAGEGLAEALGALWAAHSEAALREVAADLVIPVPLHWVRRLARGYNQSEALARELAARCHLPPPAARLAPARPAPPPTNPTNPPPAAAGMGAAPPASPFGRRFRASPSCLWMMSCPLAAPPARRRAPCAGRGPAASWWPC